MRVKTNGWTLQHPNVALIPAWTARLCLLLPFFLAGRTVGSALLCLAGGTALWCMAAGRVQSLAKSRDIADGKKAEIVLWGIRLLYELCTAAVFLRLTAELIRFVFWKTAHPGLLGALLAAAVLLAGLAGRRKSESRQYRGFFQIFMASVTILTGLLALFLLCRIRPLLPAATAVRAADELPAGIFEVFAVLGGTFLPAVSPDAAETGEEGASLSLARAAVISTLVAGVFCLSAAAISFPAPGWQIPDFSALEAAGTLRRGKTLLACLLLPGLTVVLWQAFGSIRMYAHRLLDMAFSLPGAEESLAGEGKSARKIAMKGIWPICLLLACALAAGFVSVNAAVGYFRAFAMHLLIPGMCFFYIYCDLHRRKTKKRLCIHY